MRKAGFTLIEALAVIAVTGLIVSMIYTVGIRGAFNGFRLGNRALGLADAEIDKAAWQALVADMVLPPVAVSSQAAELELADEVDDSFVGAPAEIDAYLIASRETPCAQRGASGQLIITLEENETTTQVKCKFADSDPVTLMELKGVRAAFEYSEDGQVWATDWIVQRGMPVEDAALPNGDDRHVLIRLATEDGRSDILAFAASGRPISQTAAVGR